MAPALVAPGRRAALPGAGAQERRLASGSGIAWSLGSTVLALLALVVSHAALAGAAAGADPAAADLGLADLPRDEFRRAGRARQREERARAAAPAPLAAARHRRAAGYLGAAPRCSGLRARCSPRPSPLLVPLAIWIYTLVFAFSSLWFAHYCWRRWAAARASGAARAPCAATAAGADAAARRRTSRLEGPAHELRPDHRRRRNPVGQARRQAHAQGHRAAGRARLRWLGRYVGDVPVRITADLRAPSPPATSCSPAAASAPRPTTTRASARRRRWACRWRCIPRRDADPRAHAGHRRASRARPTSPTAPDNIHRLNMGVFPAGARDHPQPLQQDPRLLRRRRCIFVPGFPVMARPMIESVLDGPMRHLHVAPRAAGALGDRLRRHGGDADAADGGDRARPPG